MGFIFVSASRPLINSSPTWAAAAPRRHGCRHHRSSQIMHPTLALHAEALVCVVLLAHHISRPASCQGSSEADGECKPQSCGNLTDVRYPFWLDGKQPSSCGLPLFEVNCSGSGTPIFAQSYNGRFSILDISYDDNTVTLRDWYHADADCSVPHYNASYDDTLLTVAKENRKLYFFYECMSSTPTCPTYAPISCLNSNTSFAHLGGQWEAPEESLCNGAQCKVSVVPVLAFEKATSTDYRKLLNGGFRLNWTAEGCRDCSQCASGTCICADTCSQRAGHQRHIKEIAMGIIVASGFLLICAALLFYTRQRILRECFTVFHSESDNMQRIEAFLEETGYISPVRYNYSELKRMTKSFREKLGHGGYGTVFRGTLQDGRLVAVKMLNNSKGDGQEFINEVASIGRTSHVNVVRLLGFCLERQKRALVYEFMSNGSLDKFICSDEQRMSVGWKRLHDIAVGIARGLEYLHRGCNTRIVHFDIKPHNILLNDELCPKISDFGLAKLCSPNDSIISMLNARGTAGYIAPEVFCRNFGAVSTKSDVYSYGMMVLEMTGSTTNPTSGDDNSSEAYFPQWVYKQLEDDRDLQALGENSETEKKLMLVGLWCIQTTPANRPSIRRVIEMLEGKMDDIEYPPMPSYLSPPLLSAVNSSS